MLVPALRCNSSARLRKKEKRMDAETEEGRAMPLRQKRTPTFAFRSGSEEERKQGKRERGRCTALVSVKEDIVSCTVVSGDSMGVCPLKGADIWKDGMLMQEYHRPTF